jgi:hypothetical protein
MSNALAGVTPPPGFTNIATLSNTRLKNDLEYAIQAGAGSVDPQWTWHFDRPSTWLAAVVALNPLARATRLAFIRQPNEDKVGSKLSPAPQVAAQDDAGVTDSTFTGTVSVALVANPSGGTLSGPTTVAVVNGVATFSDVSIDKEGSDYTLQVTTSGLTGATSVPFSIRAVKKP